MYITTGITGEFLAITRRLLQSELTGVKRRNKLHQSLHGGITSQQVMEYQLVFTCSRNINHDIYGILH